MFCLLVVLVRLSVPVQMIDWKEIVSEMTYNVLMGLYTLLTYSLTLQQMKLLIPVDCVTAAASE